MFRTNNWAVVFWKRICPLNAIFFIRHELILGGLPRCITYRKNIWTDTFLLLNSQKVPEHSWISIHGKISCSRSFHGTRGLQRDPGPGIDFWTLFWDRDRILKTVTLIYLENTFLKKLCQEQNFGVSLNFGSRAFKVLKTGHYNLRSFFFESYQKDVRICFSSFFTNFRKKNEKKKQVSKFPGFDRDPGPNPGPGFYSPE